MYLQYGTEQQIQFIHVVDLNKAFYKDIGNCI